MYWLRVRHISLTLIPELSGVLKARKRQVFVRESSSWIYGTSRNEEFKRAKKKTIEAEVRPKDKKKGKQR